MSEKSKKALITLLPFVFIYIVFNYLPIERWLNSGSLGEEGADYIYLSIKLAVYLTSSVILLLLKKKGDFEITKPLVQAGFVFLIPLFIPNMGNFLYVYFLNSAGKSNLHYGLLVYDLLVDFFGSVFEDTMFVDMVIYILIDVLKKKKHAKGLSVLLAGAIFTAVHAYSYIYDPIEVALFQQFYVFLLTMECGYLAIYFDSPWYPILAHYYFNALNHVAFEFFYYIDRNLITPKYIIFTGVIALMAFFYTYLLWNYSRELAKVKTLGEKLQK